MLQINVVVPKELVVAIEEHAKALHYLADALRTVPAAGKTTCRCSAEDLITDARHAEELAEDDQPFVDEKPVEEKKAPVEEKKEPAKKAPAKKAPAKKSQEKNDTAKNDETPGGMSSEKIKRDLILPLQDNVFKDNKKAFMQFINEHIRPMLQEQFDADNFLGVKPGMTSACYVRTREVINDRLAAFCEENGIHMDADDSDDNENEEI